MNITVIEVLATSISLSWYPPPVDDRNGIISQYSVRYTSVYYSTERLMNTTDTSVVLMDLEEFEEYEVSIAAATVEGVGPYSMAILVTTAQAGKSVVCCNIVSSFGVGGISEKNR